MTIYKALWCLSMHSCCVVCVYSHENRCLYTQIHYNRIIFDFDLSILPPDALLDFSQGELIVVGKNATAGIFATYPSKHLTLVNGFLDQVTLP